MNKRGEKLVTTKMITMVLVLVVVVFGFIALFASESSIDFFKSLPGHFGMGGNPPNLTIRAEVYNTDVLLRLNDGEGRCIIEDVYPVNDPELGNELARYGIRENQLLKRTSKETKDWQEVDMKMQRVTDTVNELGYLDIISTPGYGAEAVKMQLIKQDLFVGCYRSKEDFIEAEILGKAVKLLTKDEFGRCLIYESEDDKSLEQFSLKKNLFSEDQLYWLNLQGKWDPINDEIPTTEELEEKEIILGLQETERELAIYLSKFNYVICNLLSKEDCKLGGRFAGLSISNQVGTKLGDLIEKVGKEEALYFFEPSNSEEKKTYMHFLPKFFQEKEGYDWEEEGGRFYITKIVDGKKYAVSDQVIYVLEGKNYEKKDETNYYKIQALLIASKIKSQLSKLC